MNDVTQNHEFVMLSGGTSWFIETAMAIEALKARAREMRDDFTRALALVLADTSNQPPGDPNAHLAAGLIVSTWTVAFIEAQKLFDRTRDAAEAKRCLLAVVDRGRSRSARTDCLRLIWLHLSSLTRRAFIRRLRRKASPRELGSCRQVPIVWPRTLPTLLELIKLENSLWPECSPR